MLQGRKAWKFLWLLLVWKCRAEVDGELDLSLCPVLLSSCQAAAHSMFWCHWRDLCSSWASSSPKDSSPIPPLPPTHVHFLVPRFFGSGSIPVVIFHKDLSLWLLADTVFPHSFICPQLHPWHGGTECSGEVTACSGAKFVSITELQITARLAQPGLLQGSAFAAGSGGSQNDLLHLNTVQKGTCECLQQHRTDCSYRSSRH